MYLPSLTDDELLAYTRAQELTPMESELVKRFEAFREETGDKDADIERLDDEVNRLTEELNELKGAV